MHLQCIKFIPFFKWLSWDLPYNVHDDEKWKLPDKEDDIKH